MTFEAVLPALKEGKKAVRTGWEGTELYVQLVPEGKFEGDRGRNRGGIRDRGCAGGGF